MKSKENMKTACFFLTPLLLITFAWANFGNAQEPAERHAPESGIEESRSTPTDTWAIRLVEGVDPKDFGRRHGLEYTGPVGSLKGYYLFRIPEDKARILRGKTVLAVPEMLWLEQQQKRMRFKRLPEDPLFEDQWHLQNTGQSGGSAGVDVNVVPAWDMGRLGSEVQIAIVDDGLQYTHPDLADNYIPEDSWDYFDDNPDPYPQGAEDNHGTSVAGVAAARDDGVYCGAGVSYRAGLSGIRLISGPVTDAQEAQSLTHNYHNNHIYNNSWGPKDDGQRLEGPGTLTMLALQEGINKGRKGLGSIFVWAAGNGRANNDNINYDGYASSRYTIAVGAVDHHGKQTRYSEPGAPMLITAPSSGAGVGVTTTDRLSPDGYNSSGPCTPLFGGTSSSAPLVSGIIALMLEANPELTWRDVQHILIRSTVRNNPENDEWQLNGAGKWINHRYGFGLIDAARAVSLADEWPGTAQDKSFDSNTIHVGRHVPAGDPAGISSSFTVPRDMKLEHVQVIFTASHPYRGDLQIELTSPEGTTSVLAEQRADYSEDYQAWKFMSVRHWGEPSRGKWTLKVADLYQDDDASGTFDSWQLILHGTERGRKGRVPPEALMLILGD